MCLATYQRVSARLAVRSITPSPGICKPTLLHQQRPRASSRSEELPAPKNRPADGAQAHLRPMTKLTPAIATSVIADSAVRQRLESAD